MSETKDEISSEWGKKPKLPLIGLGGQTEIKAGTKNIGNTISPKVIQQL